MRALSGNQAWQAIGAIVVYHEMFCDNGQLLSEATDRGRAKHPVLVPVAITITALHLLRLLPPSVDPFKWLDRIAQPLKGNQWQSLSTKTHSPLPPLTRRRQRRSPSRLPSLLPIPNPRQLQRRRQLLKRRTRS